MTFLYLDNLHVFGIMADPNSAMNDTILSKTDHSNNLTQITCVIPNRTATQVAETMVCALIFLTSLLGNALVVSVVYKERRMRTSVNFLITNLAVSDFLSSTLVIPKLFVEIFYYKFAWLIEGSLGAVSCKTVYFLQDASVAVSLLSLLFIAIERYTAISTPLPADTSEKVQSNDRIYLADSLCYVLNIFLHFQLLRRKRTSLLPSKLEASCKK